MHFHFFIFFVLVFFCQTIFSFNGTYKDSRNQITYQTISYDSLTWFRENLSYQNTSSYAVNSKRVFYPKESLSSVCPAPYTIPTIDEWKAIEKQFLKSKNKKAFKRFRGNPLGFYQQKGNNKRVQQKNTFYFWAKGETDYQVVRFHPKTGRMTIETPASQSLVSTRCVRPRDYLAEKGIENNLLTDKRNGKQYPIFKINNTIWMNANLAYDSFSSKAKKDTLLPKNCYMEDPFFCSQYGRYYTWSEAKKACPPGWRLPNDSDWRSFIKQNSIDWENMGRGGVKDWDSYGDASNAGHYWSSSKAQKTKPRAFEFRKSSKGIDRTDEDPKKGLYVRCVTDIE